MIEKIFKDNLYVLSYYKINYSYTISPHCWDIYIKNECIVSWSSCDTSKKYRWVVTPDWYLVILQSVIYRLHLVGDTLY